MGRPHVLKARKSAVTPAKAGEATSRTLAKAATGSSRPTPATSQPAKAGRAPVPTRGEHKANGEPSSGAESSIVRATTRFLIDLGLRKSQTESQRAEILARRRIFDDLERMVTTARNVAIRALVQRDGQALDRYLTAHGAKPKKAAEWLAPGGKHQTPGYCYSYPLMVKAVPELATPIVANLQRKTDAEWKTDRYDVLVREIRSPRHYKLGGPIPFPQAVVKLSFGGSGATISVPVFSTKREGERRISFELSPRDERQEEEIADLKSGALRSGELTIQRDRLRPWKWYARLAVKRKVEKPSGAPKWAGVTLGLRCFLVAAVGEDSWIYDGADLVAFLAQSQARRREYQRAAKASGRAGHGRKRTLRPIAHLEGCAERWRQSRIATISSRLAEWLGKRGVTHVAIEDFSGIRDAPPMEAGQQQQQQQQQQLSPYIWEKVQEWPYYRQQMMLESKLAERGIEVVKVEAHHNTQRCPRCGETGASNRDLRHWQLRCQSCHFRRNLDVAQAMNVAHRGASGEVTKASGEVVKGEGAKKS